MCFKWCYLWGEKKSLQALDLQATIQPTSPPASPFHAAVNRAISLT